MSETAHAGDVDARLDRVEFAGPQLTVVPAVEERSLVAFESDVVTDVVLCVLLHPLLLVVVHDCVLDVGVRHARPDGVERDLLGLLHDLEVLSLLVARVADDHRPFEFGQVATDLGGDDSHDVVAGLDGVGFVVRVGLDGRFAGGEPTGYRWAAVRRFVRRAERVEHRFPGFGLGFLADDGRVPTDLDLLGQHAVAEVRPPARLPDQVDLVVGLHLPHVGDVVLDDDVAGDHVRERRPVVPVSRWAAVDVGDDPSRRDAERLTHFPDEAHRLALRVVEVDVNGVHAELVPLGVGLLQPWHDDLRPILGQADRDRALRRGVEHPGDVLDLECTEQHDAVGVCTVEDLGLPLSILPPGYGKVWHNGR